MPTKQQELQSLLLRLSILVATSLATISQPVAPSILDDNGEGSNAAAGLSRQAKTNALRGQILGDTRKLFQSVQKACTYLTLALRPEGSTTELAEEAKQRAESISPTSGLRDSSIDAAIAQLSDIMDDAVPKLVFLERKASSEATFHRYADLTREEVEQQDAERAMIKARGGHIVQAPHARDGKKLVKISNGGLGRVWASALGETIFALLQALGSLSQSYMDERTQAAMQKASKARDLADDLAGGDQVTTVGSKVPATIEEARQQALQATAVVWEVCEAALKEAGAGCRLYASSRQAVQNAWRKRTDLLQDALRELTEGIEGEDDGENQDAEELDEDDPFAGLGSFALPKEEREQGRRFLALLKAGCRLHSKIEERFLANNAPSDADVDLDDLDAAGDALEEAISDVTSAVLYGDVMQSAKDANGDNDGSASEDEDGYDEVKEALASFMQAVESIRATATTSDQVNGEKADDVLIDDIQDAFKKLNVDHSHDTSVQ